MDKLRPVSYIKYNRVKGGETLFAYKYEKEEGEGYFHGIVRGKTELNGHGEQSAYDYGLVEDGETGQLLKIELPNIVFKDRSSLKALEEYLEKL